MMQISVSELKTQAGKDVTMTEEQGICITKSGERIAKVTSAKAVKAAAAKRLFGLLPGDTNLDAAREERLM